MTHEQNLWDYVEAGGTREDDPQRADTQQSRRHAIKRLRAGGHWLSLLRVARTIPQPFTLNDISVAVWRACPEFFGMKGYPYPDNHKVHYILYGDRGLIAKGMILRVRQGVFRLAEGVDPAEFPGAEQAASDPRAEGEHDRSGARRDD
ncbi:MAG TPA: hypothetical protein VG013_04460 [Gemmataceae bacterium]|jgi:hypothetical protein|nr:hypothetical protein [Gemmataceae bacterium]